MKKNLSAIAIYVITLLELFINYKLDFVFGKTYDSKYIILRFIFFIIFSISVGILLGIISNEKAKTKKEKISNFVIIVIPSIVFIFSNFLFISYTWINIIPQFIKADEGILALVGGLVLGSALLPTLKKK